MEKECIVTRITAAVGKLPHTVAQKEKETVAKVTVQGIVTNNELKELMALGEVNIARSGAGVGISITIPHSDGE